MTDEERLEKWYRKQGILQGVEFHFANIYDNYYMLYTVEAKLYGRPIIYKVDGNHFIYVHGDEYEHALWVHAGFPEPIKPEDVPEFLK